MDLARFADTALVLFGHGTTRDADSVATLYQHAAELRQRGHFAEVHEAFWKQEPRLTEVVGRTRQHRVFCVPLFASEGYFSEQVIPRALGFEIEHGKSVSRCRRHGNQTWIYCRPVGTHESMTRVLLARASQVVERYPFPRAPRPSAITLFVAGHGTQQNENSRQAAEDHATRIRQMNLYAQVHAIFMDEAPQISTCFKLAETRHMVVVPFFMGDGPHVQEDLPVLLGETPEAVRRRLQTGQPGWRNPTEREGKLVWFAASVGSDALIPEVILARVREGAQQAGAGSPDIPDTRIGQAPVGAS